MNVSHKSKSKSVSSNNFKEIVLEKSVEKSAEKTKDLIVTPVAVEQP